MYDKINFNESFDLRIKRNIKNYEFSFNYKNNIDNEVIEKYKKTANDYFQNDLEEHLQDENNSIETYLEKESRKIDDRTIGEFYADFIFKGWVCEDFFIDDMKKYDVIVDLNGNDKDRTISKKASTAADFKILDVPFEYQISIGDSLKLKKDKLNGLVKRNSYLLGKTKKGYLVISAKKMNEFIKENNIEKIELYSQKFGWLLNFKELEDYMFEDEESLKEEFLRIQIEEEKERKKIKDSTIYKNKLFF